jgi:oxygen-independent coproporphyrinogen-3 oxidase
MPVFSTGNRCTMPGLPFDIELLRRHDAQGPRYTTYPTERNFQAMSQADHIGAVLRGNRPSPDAPVSLLLRAPFFPVPSHSGDEERRLLYLEALLQELRMQGSLLGASRPVERLHLGDRLASVFDDDQLALVVKRVESAFGVTSQARRDFSIEIDPHTVDARRLARLSQLGFNRILLAMQAPHQQDTLHQDGVAEHIAALVLEGRRLQMRSISLRVTYAHPRQSVEGFDRSLDRVIASQPDRIEIEAYAPLPGAAGPNLRSVSSELPDSDLRLRLLQLAIRKLTAVGYVHLGMDQFARVGDELVLAMAGNRLQWGAGGYSAHAGLDLIGAGAGGTSRIGGAYTQNSRRIEDYIASIAAGFLPTVRGWLHTNEDLLRACVIERILCGREIRYGVLSSRFGVDARRHFRAELAMLGEAASDGLVELLPDRLIVTRRGRYFLHAVATPFDAYLRPAAHGSAAGRRSPHERRGLRKHPAGATAGPGPA